MSSFLAKKKTIEAYEEKISTEPRATQLCKKYAINNFANFVAIHYGDRTIYEIVEELQIIREKEGATKYDEELYQMLQDWINWNEKFVGGNHEN